MRIETTPVACVDLAVDERLRILRTRLAPDGPLASGRRLCVVTGTHGDELEGQYVCYELLRRVRAHPEWLRGTLDVYPAVNPLGIDSIRRGMPHFDLDLNRLFPGRDDGCMPEWYLRRLTDDLLGADLVLDVHASNIFLKEIPQIRVNELSAERLLPLAMKANVDYVWVHASATVLEATLAYSLNTAGTPCLVVEMGIGMRLTRSYGDQLVDGILNLMAELGIWAGPVGAVRRPVVSTDGEVRFVNADEPGIFVAGSEHTAHLEQGEPIGQVIDPLTGEVRQELRAPCSGLMFTLRAYPVVYAGSLVARMLEDGAAAKATDQPPEDQGGGAGR